jgi:ParB/RepB/Spo0J family partition protein
MTTATTTRETATPAAATGNGHGATFQPVPLTALRESPTNPRKHFKAIEELTASIQSKGLLTPLLVRPLPASSWRTPTAPLYEIVAGHRRYRAAKAAGVAEVPVLVRELTDAEVIEIQVIENNQREDVHPLEEAEGYRQLMETAKYDVARIAERVGRSVKYVYDRVKLLALTKAAQQLFLDGTITAGHAILLARLKPADQARAIGDPKDEYRDGGLLTSESLLWDPEEQGRPAAAVKPVSVRELQAWIDKHVKFEKFEADPMLFPETVQTVTAAKEQAEKVVQITHEFYIDPETRDAKERIYFPRSWTRADGKHGSKPCDRAVTGVVVVGPARGEAFRVCVDKKGCTKHWAKEQREAKHRATAATAGGRTGEERWKIEEERRRQEQARLEAERARWKKAEPAILDALAAAVKKASTKAGGLLADLVLRRCRMNYQARNLDTGRYVARGTTAEDFVRHAAFVVLTDELLEWSAPQDFPKRAKAFNLDVRKIVDQVAPPPTPEPAEAAAKSKAGKKAKRKAA